MSFSFKRAGGQYEYKLKAQYLALLVLYPALGS